MTEDTPDREQLLEENFRFMALIAAQALRNHYDIAELAEELQGRYLEGTVIMLKLVDKAANQHALLCDILKWARAMLVGYEDNRSSGEIVAMHDELVDLEKRIVELTSQNLHIKKAAGLASVHVPGGKRP